MWTLYGFAVSNYDSVHPLALTHAILLRLLARTTARNAQALKLYILTAIEQFDKTVIKKMASRPILASCQRLASSALPQNEIPGPWTIGNSFATPHAQLALSADVG